LVRQGRITTELYRSRAVPIEALILAEQASASKGSLGLLIAAALAKASQRDKKR
jgi:hypothetical protein